VGVAPPPGGISVGADFLPGTQDDSQIGAGSIPDNVHWFRIIDNNPFAIDSMVVDINTFSPSVVLNLPSGHSWTTNANRRAAESLGFMDTQAVMYSMVSSGERKVDLTADDVNMVKMGMVGQDLLAGTADDYSIELQFTGICAGDEDVIITLGEAPDGVAAFCQSAVDFSFSQNPFLARHVTLQPFGESFFIFLNQTVAWDTSAAADVFASSFETGDFSDWSSAVGTQ
jgi:hypothetical protein